MMTFKGAFAHLSRGNRIRRANWHHDMYVFGMNPAGESIVEMKIHLVADTALTAIKEEEIVMWFKQPKRTVHDWIVLKK